ncbi:hypothetical protein Tco_1481100, partial [Tanacetum coccineum]
MMVQDQEEVGKGSKMPTDPHHTPTIIQPSTSQPLNKQRSRRPKRKDTQVPQPSGPTTNVADEAVNEEIDDSLVRAATTASSLEAEQDNGNIDKTQSKATPNEPSSLDRLKLEELMALYTTLQSRVLTLETTKISQSNEIAGLKRRVKKLERRNKSRTHGLKRLYKVGSSRRVESSGDEEDLGEEDASKQERRIHDIDADEDITLVNDNNEMFDVGTLIGDEVLAEQVVAAKDVNLSVDEVNLAQALAALKSAKVLEKGDVIKEPSVPVSDVSASTKDSAATTAATTTTATILTPRKGIVFQEPVEFDEEVRLAREKAKKEQEANVALTEEWDDIQAKIKADHDLAQRLQAQDQEELSDVENATLFVQLLEKRRKHFAAKRAEKKRNKPPTQAQQIKIIAFKRVDTFVNFRTDMVEGSSKRAREELEHENAKKQKVDDDKETTELKSLMEVMPNEKEVALDAIPLAVKSPSIVDWKIHKEGK